MSLQPEVAREFFQSQGPTFIVLDTSFGDGGKGKVVDSAGEDVDANVRYSGGPNAGHTVFRGKELFVFHGVPSSILHPDTLSVVAPTVVVNPITLAEEITRLQERGVEISPKNLLISPGAHLIMPWHKERDVLNETARGGEKIGTTGTGNGPTYSDRALRVGLRVGDLLDPASFQSSFDAELRWQEELIRTMRRGVGEEIELDREAILAQLLQARQVLLPFIGETQRALWNLQDNGKVIMGEGAQGALLDLDLGGYPFVTSGHPGRAGFELGTGIHDVNGVIGVTKAYATRVGEGPMPTELLDETGEDLRERGGEVGRTTGRKRRVGWFDALAVKYGARISGTKSLAITKLDIFDGLPEVKICVGYTVDGVEYKQLDNASPAFMRKAKPIYETLPWGITTAGIKSFDDLPENAQNYLGRLEELVGLPVEIVTVGPQPEDAMYRRRVA